MPGLLDLVDDPNQLGLLSLGMRLMSTPGKFGAALGQAGMGALGDVQQARSAMEARKLREQQMRFQQLQEGRADAAEQRLAALAPLQQEAAVLQLRQAQEAERMAQEERQRLDAFRRSIPSPQSQALQALGADASPTAANAARMPQVDPRSQFLFDALQARQIKPMDYLTATKPKEPEFKVVGDSLVQIGGGRVSEAYRAPTKPEAAPAAVREYQFAKDQGYPGTFRQFQLEQRRAGASNVNVNTGDNKFEAKAAEVLATQLSDTYKQGQAATRTLGQVNRLDDLLKKTGGGFTPAFKMYAGQFGINTSGLDDIQAAEAVIQSLIPQQRPPGSGTMSDRDVELFRQSLPRLINQPGGNKKIVGTMRGIAEYDRKLGQISSDALTGKITREKAVELMNALPNPLADFTGGEDIHSQAEAIIRGAVNGKR
jgi:flagellar protein FlgJ